MKTCTRCKAELPLDAFRDGPRYAGKKRSWCRQCERDYEHDREQLKRADPAFVQSKREKSRSYRAANLERVRARDRTRAIEKKYGITAADLASMLQLQEHRCAICKAPFSAPGADRWTGPNVDHDHATGVVRGLLCGMCNNMLGHAKDSVETLQAAIGYLAQDSARRAA